MPPRVHICLRCLCAGRSSNLLQTSRRQYATIQAITPAPSLTQQSTSTPPVTLYPPTQPPSHRPPEFRRSQLHRQYTSLLRSSPLILLFQHSNLKATEWMSVRRELSIALHKVDSTTASESSTSNPAGPIADATRLQIIQSGVFGAALRVADFFHPELQPEPEISHPTDPATYSSTPLPKNPLDPSLRHGLSRTAYTAVAKRKHAFDPLLSGPLAVLSFPTVSPAHLKAALSILAPSAPDFRAPTRRANPGYYDPAVQGGLQKLMLLGVRVEGRVMDGDGARWVGGIDGGIDSLRAQVVAVLQGVGGGVVRSLDGMSRSVYWTLEGRRGMLEEQGGKEGKEAVAQDQSALE